MKAPWDYSAKSEAGAPLEGRALGKKMARLADQAEVKMRSQFPKAPPRCDDCAFRLGTRPNGCPFTLMDALKCVLEGKPFYCHKGVSDGKPKRLCAGWALVMEDRK